MFKRLVSLHLCLCLLFLTMVGKVAYIATSGNYTVAGNANSVVLDINQRRGAFYDTNMNLLTNSEVEYVAILRPTEKVFLELHTIFSKEDCTTILEQLKSGKPILRKVPAGTVSTANIPIVSTSNRYSSSQILTHTIGYYSDNPETQFGLEKSFKDYLTTNASLKIQYHVDALGRMLSGDTGKIIEENYNSKRGVQLTIDKNLQTVCETVADETKGFNEGAIVILDVKSSKILAMVSRPNIDLNDLSKGIEDINTPFINRALSAYAVGSAFKLTVASAAIENGLEDFTHHCTGSVNIGSLTFNCHKLDGHGAMNLNSAIGQSCNPYFINLGQTVGGEVLLNQVEKFGFDEQTDLADGFFGAKGNLPTIAEVKQRGNLANFSFGQGSLLATPLQVANMVACIANNGQFNEPTLVEGFIDDNGKGSAVEPVAQSKTVISTRTAKMLQQYMIEAVETGSGRNGKPAQGGAGGKTATAETGWINEKGEAVLHSWFVGFYPAKNPKYAVAIMDENGKSGAVDCCPIFRNIIDKMQ